MSESASDRFAASFLARFRTTLGGVNLKQLLYPKEVCLNGRNLLATCDGGNTILEAQISAIGSDADGTIWLSETAITTGLRHAAKIASGEEIPADLWETSFHPIIARAYAIEETMLVLCQEVERLTGRPVPHTPGYLVRSFDDLLAEMVQSDKEPIHPIDPVIQFLRMSHTSNLPITIVTGSPPRFARAAATYVGVSNIVSSYPCAGDYKKGKPHPEPYQPFAVDGGMALEDSIGGTLSALAARVPTIVSCIRDQGRQASLAEEYAKGGFGSNLLVLSSWDQLVV